MVTVIFGLFILVKDVMEETFLDGRVTQEMDLQLQQSKVLDTSGIPVLLEFALH